jgi:hypothetical protein
MAWNVGDERWVVDELVLPSPAKRSAYSGEIATERVTAYAGRGSPITKLRLKLRCEVTHVRSLFNPTLSASKLEELNPMLNGSDVAFGRGETRYMVFQP